jgi:hypothetical protein
MKRQREARFSFLRSQATNSRTIWWRRRVMPMVELLESRDAPTASPLGHRVI